MFRRTLTPLGRVAAIWCLWCLPAYAQRPDQILAKGQALMAKNEYQRAVDVLNQVPDAAPARVRVLQQTSLALALMNLGRLSEVPSHLVRARALADQAVDASAKASVDLADGYYLRWTGNVDGGVRALLHAAEWAQKSGDRDLLGRVYGGLSTGYQELEDWERAMYYTQKGFELLEHPSLTDRFDHAMQSGIAYFELYERDAAETQYQKGLALATESHGKRNESWARGELAYVYWTFDHDAARALQFYGQAIALAAEAHTPTLENNWLLNRGNVLRDSGQHAAALHDYRRVIEIENQTGAERLRFPATKNIGQTYRLMGRYSDALRVLRPLVERRPWRPSPRYLWQAHMELASTYERLGKRDRADAEYRAMLDVLEEQRHTSILDAFRTGSFAHSLSAYDPYERYIRFLAATADRSETAAATLQVAEQARARGFLDALASVRSAVASKLPSALLDDENRIMRAISDIQERLRAPDLPRVEREKRLADLTRLEQDRDNFRLKLSVEHPSLAEMRYPQMASASELQASLRPEETIVSFFLGEPESFRWTIRRDQVELRRLAGRKAIEAQTERLGRLLRVPANLTEVRGEGAALAAMLLGDLNLPDRGPLVVVPHGVLNYVPFEMLPVSGRLLIKQHPVSYASSLNSLARLRRGSDNPGPFRILAVGNPAVAAAPKAAAIVRAADVDNVALLGPLPFAEEELAAIGRTFGASTETLSGPSARESRFRQQDLGRFRVIHFATHALVTEAHPTRSGLLFSPEPGEDGLLQMGEIYRLGLRSDLVVLSACQTALGREITGEGIVGLTRAFFYAGSRAVVAALWNLNDRFAADFVERFYREIAAGRPPEDALRRAKLTYVNDPRYGHPFYWASLVLAGDGTRPLAAGPPDTSPGLSAAAGLAAVILLVIVGYGILRGAMSVRT